MYFSELYDIITKNIVKVVYEMNIRFELLSDFASDTACDEFEEISIYTDNIVDTTVVSVLSDI